MDLTMCTVSYGTYHTRYTDFANCTVDVVSLHMVRHRYMAAWLLMMYELFWPRGSEVRNVPAARVISESPEGLLIDDTGHTSSLCGCALCRDDVVASCCCLLLLLLPLAMMTVMMMMMRMMRMVMMMRMMRMAFVH